MTRDELLAPGAGLELLLDIRLDGITTGYATAMLTIAVAAVIGAFIVGGLIGVALMASKRARGSTPIPFGPALVLAAALAPLALG